MPSLREQKRIEELVKAIDSGAVQSAEFLQVIEALKAIIVQLKDKLETNINDSKGELSQRVESVLVALQEKESQLTSLISQTKDTTYTELRLISERISDEIKRVEALIPDVTDLAPLEKKISESIEELEKKIPKLPEEVSAEAIIRKLEAVEDNEDKLSIDAIKDLREELKKFKKSMEGGRGTGYAGFRALRVIQDEGTALTERNKINFVGAGVTVTDDPANDATKVTIGGGSGTSTFSEVVAGSGTTFTLAATPTAGTVRVYGLGQRLKSGAGNDYTISGAVLTMANSWSAGEILADYQT